MSDNYYNDHRVRGAYRAGKKPILWNELKDGSMEEIVLPTKKEVCPTCHGTGKHVNPSIDCNGLSAEDFAEDPDFREDYMRGTYDVTCYECGGNNVVDAVDWDRMTEAQTKAYEEQENEEAEYQAMCRAERRMGC